MHMPHATCCTSVPSFCTPLLVPHKQTSPQRGAVPCLRAAATSARERSSHCHGNVRRAVHRRVRRNTLQAIAMWLKRLHGCSELLDDLQPVVNMFVRRRRSHARLCGAQLLHVPHKQRLRQLRRHPWVPKRLQWRPPVSAQRMV